MLKLNKPGPALHTQKKRHTQPGWYLLHFPLHPIFRNYHSLFFVINLCIFYTKHIEHLSSPQGIDVSRKILCASPTENFIHIFFVDNIIFWYGSVLQNTIIWYHILNLFFLLDWFYEIFFIKATIFFSFDLHEWTWREVFLDSLNIKFYDQIIKVMIWGIHFL